MTTSSLCGKPDDYESRKSWTNKDWYTHVGAWVNDSGQLCFGSPMAFCAMLEQFHRTHTRDYRVLAAALSAAIEGCENNHPLDADITSWLPAARDALAKVTGAA
jgi:hypothetical protein